MVKRARDGVSIHTGFPNPATDTNFDSLDINQLLIKHPASTFLMRLEGNQWEERGIFNGDVVIVDRALDPSSKDLSIWWQDDSFVIGSYKQMPKETQEWGVVTAIIHQTRP